MNYNKIRALIDKAITNHENAVIEEGGQPLSEKESSLLWYDIMAIANKSYVYGVKDAGGTL